MNGVEVVASWLTPSILFCVLNLMIGTIFITSSRKPNQNQPKHGENVGEQPPQYGRSPSFLERVKSINLSRDRSEQPDGEQPPQLGRSPSFLERVKSINLSRHRSEQPDGDQPPQIGRSPSFLERVKSINLSRNRSELPDPVEEQSVHQQTPQHETEEPHHVTRTKSDAVAKAKPAARKLKKSASVKVVANKREEEEEMDHRRPATVRERPAVGGEDDAVDDKADDFINRFRQQLKLQRLDSILRYSEMLNRGASR